MKKEILLLAKLLGLSEQQILQLKLIELVNFKPLISGEKIVDDLLHRSEVWESCLMDRFEDLPLLKLRDLPKQWNVDTLYIIPEKDNEKELEELVKTWQPDEIVWIEQKEAQRLMNRKCRILRARWGSPSAGAGSGGAGSGIERFNTT